MNTNLRTVTLIKNNEFKDIIDIDISKKQYKEMQKYNENELYEMFENYLNDIKIENTVIEQYIKNYYEEQLYIKVDKIQKKLDFDSWKWRHGFD